MPEQWAPARGDVEFGTRDVRLRVAWSADGPVVAHVDDGRLRGPARAGDDARRVQPLVEILAVGHGHRHGNLRNTATAVGARLRYVGHHLDDQAGWRTLRIRQRDVATGLETVSVLRAHTDRAAVEAWTIVRNGGQTPVHLQAVSSLALADPVGARALDDVVSIEGASEWLGEWRWSAHPVRGQEGLPDVGLAAHQHQDGRGSRSVVGRGAWSSGERVPCGVLTTADGSASVAWQVQSAGGWRTELAERLAADGTGVLVLGLLGPTDVDHGWLHTLAPGLEFTSVPVSLAWAAGGWQAAVAELTAHRRALRAPTRAGTRVVFNDYMNTLMGDPTTERLLPLVDAAARVGADYFCIDAGWYDDGGDWWDSVGEWRPSDTRFPDGGIDRVLQAVRSAGMVPGLWLEPEVVGVRSPLARELPDDAFLQRRGVRLVEHGRYLLDLRAEQARKHLDAVVDRLVEDHGVGYLKLDYNVTPGVGTDREADSPGDGLLRHTRAYLDWLDGVLARHPQLVIENCASGAMRADYALLTRAELQSTSDQQEPLRYPPVAAGALVAVLPEQAGNWAYPQATMTDEEIVFTMVTGLSGRLYLSGRLDAMTDRQLGLVAAGVELARTWDDAALQSVPVWPAGLPRWDDAWVAVGRTTGSETVLAVWWRGHGDPETTLDVPAGDVEVIYPPAPDDDALTVRADGTSVRLRATRGEPVARMLRIRHDDADR